MTTKPKKAYKSKAAVGASLVVLSSLFYGSYGVWTKLMGHSFGDYTQGGLRSLLVVAMLLPIAFWRKQLARIHWRRDARWLLLMFVSSCLIAGPLYYATLKIGVGLAAALGYAGIVLSMFFFGWLFSGEKYTKSKFVSTTFGFIGLWLIFTPTLHAAGFLPLLAAFASGIGVGLDVVASQKIPYSASQATILTWSTSIVGNLLIAFLLREKLPHFHADVQWLYLVIFAVASLASSWLVVAGVKLIDAGAAGILGLLEVVFGVIFGVIFFGERPGVIIMLGVASILIAAAIPYLQHFRLKDEPFEL